MPYPYQKATCRGSLALGSGCGRCERCADEMNATFRAHRVDKIATTAPTPAAKPKLKLKPTKGG